MKAASLSALACLAAWFVAGGIEARGGPALTLSHTVKNLGTRETASREGDGLAITFPADEADVIELLLPTIAKYRTERRAAAREEAAGIAGVYSDDDVQAKYRKEIPHLLALESTSGKSFEASYDAAVAEVGQFARQWEKWSGALGSLRFWNRVTSQPFKQGERTVFPEISFEPDRPAGNTKFTFLPPLFNRHIGLEFMRPPAGVKGGTSPTDPFQLDLPIRALARCYLMPLRKAGGAMAGENESQMLQQLLYFDVPTDPADGSEFLRALEAIEPFSDGSSAGDGFLKSWIDKIRKTPWNRTNAATIIAAYDELTGDSLREIIKKTVAAPSL